MYARAIYEHFALLKELKRAVDTSLLLDNTFVNNCVKIFTKIDIRSHGEMHRLITTLSKETQDSELIKHFSLAGGIHQNLYENWLTLEMVVNHSRVVKSLVEKLKGLAR